MQWKALLSFALLAPCARAMLRFSCSQLTVERLDPLIQPGIVSGHVHQIVGGNAFNVTMDPNNDLPATSTCTSCTFSEDFSNYWTAVLYFRHPNGTFERVPQMAGQFLDGAEGGMTVYYIPPYDGRTRTTAFRKGFRMIVGDPMLRSDTRTPESQALGFRCFEERFGGEQGAPNTGRDTKTLPNRFCPGGIRTNIFFPTCWDGVNLDSPDHKSHVAFTNGAYETGSPCPSTHPTRIPQVFLEINWDTRKFRNIWPTDGSQPLVFTMGDPTGYGQHADYVFGWQGDALQRAMDANCNVVCPQLRSQSVQIANQCKLPRQVQENIDGILPALPGCNPIQNGPGKATAVPAAPSCAASLNPRPPAGGPPVSATRPPTSSSRPPVSSTPVPSQPAQTVPKWGQCGGQGYTGPTVCAPGSTCTYQNQWYSQCL